MAKKKAAFPVEARKPSASETVSPEYWIYPGERRPVVVMARSESEAVTRVQTSPEYDGFPVYVRTVKDFEKRCHSKEVQKDEKPDAGDASGHLFIMVKVVDGTIARVALFSDKGLAVQEADKLAAQLGHGADDLAVFDADPEKAMGSWVDGIPAHSPVLKGAPVEKKEA